jgi:prevent-host-death family protein
MSSIIAFTEAKARLSEILDRVSKGEEFVITRHNEKIAKLVPLKTTSVEEIKQAVQQLRKLRKGVRISLDEITTWKNQGRR